MNLHDGLDEFLLGRPGKAAAMKDHGHANTLSETSSLGLLIFRVLAAVIREFLSLFKHLRNRHVVVEDPFRAGDVPLLHEVFLLEVQRVFAKFISDMVHHGLNREETLGSSETPVGPVRNQVCKHGRPGDIRILDIVAADGGKEGPLQDHVGKARIRPRVQ